MRRQTIEQQDNSVDPAISAIRNAQQALEINLMPDSARRLEAAVEEIVRLRVQVRQQ